jgi:protoheme IX farnesyltransferase
MGFVWHAVRVFRTRDGADANKRAMGLFGFSILYLFALFGVLVLERGCGLIALGGL